MEKLSERESKLIRSLRLKKNRDASRLFVAETVKVVEEMLPYFDTELLLVTAPTELPVEESRVRLVTEREMKRVSQLDCPSDCLALLRIPAAETVVRLEGLVVALDEVQNPGNIGTIIRLCDWLGIGTLLMSRGCADPYGAKVVQSTAGALGALTIHYDIDLAHTLSGYDGAIIAADLDGEPIGQASVPREAVVLFGNEGHGFGPEVKSLCTETVLIPKSPSAAGDSLNVAISAAIILSHFSQII